MRPADRSAFALILTGVISILGQVVLLRELNVSFYGSELIYIFSLGLWLLGAAVGAILQKRSAKPSFDRFGFVLASSGLLLLADIAFIRASRILFGAVPGAYLPFLLQITVAALALFPIALLTGLLFTWAAKHYIGESEPFRSLGTAYAIESVGGLLGGLAGTLCLHWGIQNLPLAIGCAYISLLALLVPEAKSTKPAIRRCRWVALLILLLIMAWMWPFGVLDAVMTRWNHPHLITSVDTPYGRITLTGTVGQVSLFDNDVLAYETEGTDAEAFIHPALLQHPSPRHILVLGGGVEGLVLEILHHNPQQVDYVELNAAMLKTAIPYLPSAMQASLKDPRVRIIDGDPRQVLARSGLYDMILIGMPEPDSGAANRFYSREFFKLCATRLKPQGIVSLRLKPAENFWTPAMALRMGSIYQALRSVFPECVFLPGTTQVITASFFALPQSPEISVSRWQERRIEGRLINRAYLSYLYTNDRFTDINRRLEATTVPANADSRPVCYQFSSLIWLAKFFPSFNRVTFINPFQTAGWGNRLPYAIFFAILLAVLGLSRRFTRQRRFLLMAAAGFIGMVQETVLLLHYQTKQGVLYQDMGLLLTSFMAGLAVGAMILRNRKPDKAWGAALVIGLFLSAILVYGLIVSDALAGPLIVMILLGLNGLFVSAIFAYISRLDTWEPQKAAAPLYAADLIGGCLGALTSGLLLIPFFGLDMTAAFMIILSTTLLILVV